MARRSSSVPVGRLERLARMGALAGGFALGGLAEGAKRLVGAGEGTGNVFLTASSATKLAKRLSRMRGAAMKLGQLVSLQGDDLVPPEFAGAMALLRQSADVMPAEQLRRVLGREYGKGWRDRFARFDEEPVASASIGQVHTARAANGRELVIKVQYPGVAKSIDSDLDSLAALLTITHVVPVEVDVAGIVAEAKRQLKQEADYGQEAEHLRRYRRLVKAAEPDCRVPRVHEDLSTTRVLAMERMDGAPIESLGEGDVAQSRRDAMGALLLRLALRELFEFRFVQTDPNFANYRVDAEGRLVLLDLGGAREYDEAFTESLRGLLVALHRGEHGRLAESCREVGFLRDDDPPARCDALVEAALLVSEPLRHRGAYDFWASDLPSRVNAARLDLVLRRGYRRAPPPRTLFLLRKFVGTYLLCAAVRARVDVGAVARPFLS